MKKTFKIIGLILSIPLIILLPFLVSSVIWIYFYNNWNYKQALNFFSILPNQSVKFYDIWNMYYNLWQYNQAIKNYLKVFNWENNKINYFAGHNLWNSFYRLWEKQQNIDKKINLRKQALDYYKKAITIWKNININKNDLDQTIANYYFVLNKLKKLQKRNNQNNQTQSKQNQKKESNNKTHQKNNSQTQQNQKTNKQNSKKNNNSSNQTKSSQAKQNNSNQNWKNNKTNKQNKENWSISKEKKSNTKNTTNNSNNTQNMQQKEIDKAIQQYEKQLLQQQKYDIKNFYQKKYQPNSQDPFDQLFNDPFFQDDPFFEWLPNNEQDRKDR